MKQISEMELTDLGELLFYIEDLERKLNVESLCEDGDVLYTCAGRLLFARLKMAWICVIQLLRMLGVTDVSGSLFLLDKWDCDMEDDDVDSMSMLEAAMIEESTISCWSLSVLKTYFDDHGFEFDECYAGLDELDFLMDADEAADMSREELVKYLMPYDIEEQLLIAEWYTDFDDTWELIDFRCFRNARFGKMISYATSSEAGVSQVPCRELVEKLVMRMGGTMYRRVTSLTDPYISSDDQALVLRLLCFEWIETGERVDYVFIRPFILLDILMMERVCEIMERDCPQLFKEGAERG